MQDEDIKEVASLEKISFDSFWSKGTFQKLLTRHDIEAWVAVKDAELVGYAVLSYFGNEAELTNIVVTEENRKLGIGSRLLSKIIDVAVGLRIEKIFLEVRSSNEQAGILYERFGFHQMGVRKGYYKNPKEDAQILCKIL